MCAFKKTKILYMNSLINSRKIRLLIFSVLLLAAGSGCRKYLNQAPENSLTREEFFKTEADAIAAIMGAYDALQACSDKFLTWGEFRADLVSPVTNNDITYPYYQFFDITKPASVWTQPYTLIGRANLVIEAVPGIPALDTRFTVEESKAIVAEALFLRSLAYFYLVRTFKEVPLVLSAPSNDGVSYLVPKVSADSILKQIEEDLAIAEADILVQYVKNEETRGRATRAAVNALQADVYLWQARYEEAAAAAKKVLDNSSLYSLVPGSNWFSIFSQKNSSESIFEVQYDYQILENNNLKNVVGNFNMNNVLYEFYNTEQDLVRGVNRTYRQVGAYQYWKYRGLNTDNIERPTNDPNYIIYRLADVMLMRAEALAHLGFTEREEAVVLLNTVRERAGIVPYNFIDGNTDTPLFMELIMKERAMELATEGKRWFDLVRVATNDNNPDFLINRVVLSRTVGERAQIKARIIDPRSWYLPIHRDELNANPNLVQNPYYR
jgi:starch-binding outer membrane protein, SusD/RagB family